MPATMFRVLCLLFCCLVNASAQGFLRQGFSSQRGSEARNALKLDDNEFANGMSREMYLMKEIDWELHPADFSGIKDASLRRHVESFFQHPVLMKLSPRKGKRGLRAMGRTSGGKRLRGFWRPAGGMALNTGDFLSASYDDAVRTRLSTLEFEVQLPPMSRKSGNLPSVIYSVAVEPGPMNAKSIVPRGAGLVRVMPNGSSPQSNAESIDLGKAHVSLPMRAGIVDPSWAKGRAVFRKGRPTGLL